MWRNYLTAALHNLFRSRAYAAINILGLAVGFAAALLIALYVRDELSYDRMWPHEERIYRLSMDIKGPTPASLGNADGQLGPALALDFPEVEVVSRVWWGNGWLSHKNVSLWPRFRRADPEFFAMFPPRVLAGDANAALHKPDQIVITRSFARNLFGREDVIGLPIEAQLFGNRTYQVGAVIEDLPTNTHFAFDAMASALGDADEGNNALTYVRLRPGADANRLRAALPDFVRRHMTAEIAGQPVWKIIELKFTALADLHFLPAMITDMNAPSDRRTVQALIAIGVLTLLVSAGNFVSMMTARAARRAVEVGVRKAVGATRGQIVQQFLAEGLLYAGLALSIALAAVWLSLPGFNGYLQRQIAFDPLRDPSLALAVVGAWLVVGLAASTWPAAVLSMFRPVTVLRGVLSLPGGPGRLRGAMVAMQFGVLVALIISTLTIHQQTRFAIEDQLRVPGDQVFVMSGGCTDSGFVEPARRIPGVASVACASAAALGRDLGAAHFMRPSGEAMNLNGGAVDKHFFATFGIEPIAGRLFDDDHGEDNVMLRPGASAPPSLILNETAARALGYARPEEAIGQSQYWTRTVRTADGGFARSERRPSQIVGVVPDFTVGTIRSLIQPSVYYIDPGMSFVIALKLDGRRIPETMRAVEAAWKKTNGGKPMVDARFVSQMMNDQYLDIRRQTTMFAAFSAVAIAVAALGLLGLAVFTAERQTREIGIRKCMGASRADILKFIGWQFARPVLIANLLAWPVAWFFMRRWLEGFAYHVELGPFAFVLASALALGIALATVTGHALMVSRARPVEALRYE